MPDRRPLVPFSVSALSREVSGLLRLSESKTSDVQDIHRAFRTVIVLLSSIQKVQPLDFSTTQVSQDDRYKLRLLNAVSTIMVIEHEVVAVAANHDTQSVLDLIVMCTHPGIRPAPNSDSNPSNSLFWQFFVSLNSHKESEIFQSQKLELPAIIEPTFPHWIQPDFNFVTELENYLTKHQ